MVVGVFVALGQLLVSTAFIGFVSETPADYQKRVTTKSEESRLIRNILYGKEGDLAPLKICRWTASKPLEEQAPGADCQIGPFEVAYQVDDPLSFNATELTSYLQGSTPKLHLCRNCRAAITITNKDGRLVSDVKGLRALGVFMLSDAQKTTDASSDYVSAKVTARENLEKFRKIGGTILLHPAGFTHAINVSEATKTMLLIINTAVIAIVALWLSLKGHRKVLDYFAKNGALLPLVAACGNKQFYNAIWLVTLLRVAFFLLSVIPPTLLLFLRLIPEETLAVFVPSAPDFILWLLSMLSGLACLAIIASIAELKQRHCLASFLYRYVPLLLAFLGTVVWFGAVFSESPYAWAVQQLISALPVLGISPVLLSPLFPLSSTILGVHSVVAAFLVLYVMHRNSKWFAAHLEEI